MNEERKEYVIDYVNGHKLSYNDLIDQRRNDNDNYCFLILSDQFIMYGGHFDDYKHLIKVLKQTRNYEIINCLYNLFKQYELQAFKEANRRGGKKVGYLAYGRRK
jgi:hypothetical protein